MNKHSVTICIPTWKAESFIERTLDCARSQTYRDIAIHVSVDACEDRTLEICQRYAEQDNRITIFEQSERLGWAQNTNFLLENINTEFFFLYFHDDIILPAYTEKLLQGIMKHPNATSAHCDMGHFGGSEKISVGRNYKGSVLERLGAFLVAHQGSPLRSLTRSIALKSLRMPTNAMDGFWANFPYLMKLFAAGPATHIPETLYLRWDERKGGLTDGWKKFSIEDIYSGYKSNTVEAIHIIESLANSASTREALLFCLYLRMMLRIRTHEKELAMKKIVPAEEINAAFAFDKLHPKISLLGQEVESAANRLDKRLRSLEIDLSRN